MSPRIILIGGIPGTGKTTLAEAVSKRLKVPIFSKDMLESVLVDKGLCSIEELNGIGYSLMERITISELELGKSVILDCIAPLKRVEKYWQSFKNYEIRYIECVCSDPVIHQTRIESRLRNIPAWYELTWIDVINIVESYKPCFDKKIIIDSMNLLKNNVEESVKYVSS